MTKIDHENQNNFDKLKVSELNRNICAAPDQKTIKRLSKGLPRLNTHNQRILCPLCNKKIYLKKQTRHNQLCHDLISCPFCDGSFKGSKKLKRHLLNAHGENGYTLYKQNLTNKDRS